MRLHGLAPDTLPIHPQLALDELLSSWIVALARGNATKVHTLCASFGGNQNTIWNRDIDRLCPPDVLDAFHRLTGIERTRIYESTLAHLAELIDHDHHPNGTSTWILPLGVWHRKRNRFGVQFCPVCLRMDKRPYIRRSWRLAYYTECEHHRIVLMDRCPRCGSPLMYWRGELGVRSQVGSLPIRFCSQCRCDLAYEHPQNRFEWPDWSITVATRTLMFMNYSGMAVVGDRLFEPAHEVLLVIRQLIMLMSSPKRDGQLFDAIADRLWPEGYDVLPNRGVQYERRSALERHRLFGMAVWLLLDWPARFEEVFHAANIHRHSLVRDMKLVPEWYAAQCNSHVQRAVEGIRTAA